MVAPRPFRFGTHCGDVTSLAELTAFARKIEALGISTLAAGSHEAFGVAGPLVTLGAVAAATTTLRLTSLVFNNELRHPALLAGELATLDVISGGRVEIGIGAGWLRHDHDALGVPFDQAGQRVARLAEAVQLIKQLYVGEAVTFAGTYYRVNALSITPKPVQHPHPPLFIGGGGRHMLSLAGREADIVGLDAKGTPQGTKDMETGTEAAFDQKVAWLREAAGERFDTIELHTLVLDAIVTNNRRQAAEEILAGYHALPPGVVSNVFPDYNAILASPYALVGTVDQMVADLQERRERYGISYVTLPSNSIDALAPVVERLAGT